MAAGFSPKAQAFVRLMGGSSDDVARAARYLNRVVGAAPRLLGILKFALPAMFAYYCTQGGPVYAADQTLQDLVFKDYVEEFAQWAVRPLGHAYDDWEGDALHRIFRRRFDQAPPESYRDLQAAMREYLDDRKSFWEIGDEAWQKFLSGETDLGGRPLR